jgi:hypothetical protein
MACVVISRLDVCHLRFVCIPAKSGNLFGCLNAGPNLLAVIFTPLRSCSPAAELNHPIKSIKEAIMLFYVAAMNR